MRREEGWAERRNKRRRIWPALQRDRVKMNPVYMSSIMLLIWNNEREEALKKSQRQESREEGNLTERNGENRW